MPPTLRRGHRGNAVHRAQTLLRPHFDLVLDDQFGVQTAAAVRSFQKEHSLASDGIIGRYTWEALEANQGGPPSDRSPISWLITSLEWRSQRDNWYKPNGTCNVTALATVMDWCGVPEPGDRQLEDALYLRLQQPNAIAYFRAQYPDLQGYNPRNVHGMLTWLAQQYGLQASFSAESSWDETVSFARSNGGRPVIQAGWLTGSGHILTLIGETAVGDPIFHDPWGDWEQVYGRGHSGAYRIYELGRFLGVRKPFAHRILPTD